MAFLSKRLAKWRHQQISPFIEGDILDIGCGNALLLRENKSRINHYCGIEQHQSHVEKLGEEFVNCDFLKKDLDNEPLGIDQSFDVILLIAVIEHLWNQRFIFKQLVPLLKEKGKIIITTPTPFGNDIVHPLGAEMGLFSHAAMNNHIVIYNKRRFKILASEFGLKLVKYKRFQFFSNQLAVLSR
jgi:SAM-dependent methyltransferase